MSKSKDIRWFVRQQQAIRKPLFPIEPRWPGDTAPFAGWGNGYVVVPKTHPLWGLTPDEINGYEDSGSDGFELTVPVEISFADSVESHCRIWPELEGMNLGDWVIGFHTGYGVNDIYNWNEQKVREVTLQLVEDVTKIAQTHEA